MAERQIEIISTKVGDLKQLESYGAQNPEPVTNERPQEILAPQTKKSKHAFKTSLRYEIEHANLASQLHFFFGVRLIRFVNSIKKKRSLTIDDLGRTEYKDNAEAFEAKFTRHYCELSKKYPGKKRVMSYTLLKIFKKDFVIQLFWQFVYATSRVSLVYFMYRMLLSVRTVSDPTIFAYRYASGMFLFSLLGHYANHQAQFHATYVASNMKVGILGMMYRKVNRINLYAIHKMNFGKVMSVIAGDINVLDRASLIISLLLAPFILGGAAGLQVFFWGVEGFVGPFYFLVLWIIYIITAAVTSNMRRERSYLTDKRLDILVEAIEAIRLIKMYAWESKKIDQIKDVRAKEISDLKKINFIDSISRTFALTSNLIGAFFIIVIHVSLTNELPVSRIFPSIFLMGFLKQTCALIVMQAFVLITEMKLVFTRIMSIMDLEEVVPDDCLKTLNPENALELENFTGYWINKDLCLEDDEIFTSKSQASKTGEGTDIYAPVVKNINLQAKVGTLTLIIGRTGTGKTSLLLSLTREMTHIIGERRYKGSYAYSSQEPVLFSGPLRDSILFGKPYDDVLFWKVIDVCCLTETVANLPKKEMSEIGERGVYLGVRTKAQIGLARALYANADLYLLDDPLSGLDIKLANQIFKRAVQGFLRGKTVVLATHHLRLVKYADQIVVMEQGEIAAQGSYEELMNQNEDGKKDKDDQPKKDLYSVFRHNFEKVNMAAIARAPEANNLNEIKIESHDHALKEEVVAAGQDKGLFIEDKLLDEGHPTIKIYWKYFYMVFNWKRIIPAAVLFIVAESILYLFMRLNRSWVLRQFSNTTAYIVISLILFDRNSSSDAKTLAVLQFYH